MKINLLIYSFAFALVSAENELRFDGTGKNLNINFDGLDYKFTGVPTMLHDTTSDVSDKSFHARDANGATLNLVEGKTGYTSASISDPNTGMIHSISKFPDGKMMTVSTHSNDFPKESSESPPEDDIDAKNAKVYSGSGRNPQDDGSIIDIMVLWTRKAECRRSQMPKGCTLNAQTRAHMKSLVDLAIAETNLAYTNSAIATQLRLVHAYRENTLDEDVEGYSNSLSALRSSTDGKMDDVHALRDEKGADMVALLVDHSAFCGIAYIGPRVDLMFSVTSWFCATGTYTFGHELGHNQGCEHDKGTENACSDPSYNYGYRDPQAEFRTVLAYNCRSGQCDNNPGGSCQRIQHFSSSIIEYEGKPTGNAEVDNARQINEVKAEIASYKAETFTPTVSPAPTAFPTDLPTQSPTFSMEPSHSPTASPTESPTISPAPTSSPTNFPTGTPTTFCNDCPSGTFKFALQVLTDRFSISENDWFLRRDGNSTAFISETRPNQHQLYEYGPMCLPEGPYTFTITDTFGDGICCSYGNGFYKGFLYGNEIFSGGAFGSSAAHNFNGTEHSSCVSPTTPPPTPSPTTSAPVSPTTPPPTPSPTTSAPVSPPTPPPTPAPITSSPVATPVPTLAPTTSNGTNVDPWLISSAEVKFQSPHISVSYDINSGPQDFDVYMYERDCSTNLNDGDVVSVVDSSLLLDPADSISYDILVDGNKLSTSSVVFFDDATNSSGTIEFCSKMVTKTSGDLEVASKKVKVTASFDMSNVTFSVSQVSIVDSNPEAISLDVTFSISACACDQNFVCNTSPVTYTGGSTAPELRICLTPSSSTLAIKNFNLELSNSGGTEDSVEYGVAGPDPNDVTFILDDGNEKIVVTRIIEKFFDGSNSLSVSGSCLLESHSAKTALEVEIVPYELDILIDGNAGANDLGEKTSGCLQKLLANFF